MISRASHVRSQQTRRGRAANDSSLPRLSPALLRFFLRYSERYLRKHFHAVRLLRSGGPAQCVDLPLVVYFNHPSWWDPLVCLFLAHRFFPRRRAYGPIDNDSLGRYRIFGRLGFFGTDATAAGASRFIQTTTRILSTSENSLWLTPQGRFADSRLRPPDFQRGISHVATRAERAAFIPLALEYVFWEERLPEVLVSFGEPIIFDRNHRLDLDETTSLFESALSSVQDQLSAAAQRRHPPEWQILLAGRAGTNRVYDAWRQVRALFRGEKFRAAHSKL